jgi:hypothetical protein
VNEGGRLQRLAWPFVRHFLCRQFAQLVIDEGQKLVGRMRIALIDGGEDARDFAHEAEDTRPGNGSQVGGSEEGPLLHF